MDKFKLRHQLIHHKYVVFIKEKFHNIVFVFLTVTNNQPILHILYSNLLYRLYCTVSRLMRECNKDVIVSTHYFNTLTEIKLVGDDGKEWRRDETPTRSTLFTTVLSHLSIKITPLTPRWFITVKLSGMQ